MMMTKKQQANKLATMNGLSKMMAKQLYNISRLLNIDLTKVGQIGWWIMTRPPKSVWLENTDFALLNEKEYRHLVKGFNRYRDADFVSMLFEDNDRYYLVRRTGKVYNGEAVIDMFA